MENKGLLFIPDISGFTRFVNETEITHSRLIIQELLEILINANEIGLEVSEVEGDAILFYKFGERPHLEALYKQVKKMFCVFHGNLNAYDLRRYCQCKACISAIDLSLKVITHYGEFTDYNVKNFKKLIGKDIIVAHQLLKNDIENHEYWLITNNLLQDRALVDFASSMRWSASAKQTDGGEVPFHYTQLSFLKNELPRDSYEQEGLSKEVKMISVSQEYETDVITLFHASGDFNYRHRWFEGVKKVEEIAHFLPRVGMRCRCILENGEVTSYHSSSISYHPDKVLFSETDDKKKNSTHFTLEKTGNNKTKLTIDFYLPKNLVMETIFKLIQKREKEVKLRKSLQNLVPLIKEIRIPGRIPVQE